MRIKSRQILLHWTDISSPSAIFRFIIWFTLEGLDRGTQPLQVLGHFLLHLIAADAMLQTAAHAGNLISGGSMRVKDNGAITERQATDN
jgi:hypothetical protein